eukprot:SAG31_NODE_1446_length_8318_cov_8.573914_8_plen_194_part_00
MSTRSPTFGLLTKCGRKGATELVIRLRSERCGNGLVAKPLRLLGRLPLLTIFPGDDPSVLLATDTLAETGRRERPLLGSTFAAVAFCCCSRFLCPCRFAFASWLGLVGPALAARTCLSPNFLCDKLDSPLQLPSSSIFSSSDMRTSGFAARRPWITDPAGADSSTAEMLSADVLIDGSDCEILTGATVLSTVQ